MAQPVIQSALVAGELSPALHGRIDLAKFHTGAARLRNFVVDYRGGAFNRAGTAKIERVLDSTKANRVIPFTFSTEQAYALVFGNLTMRVVKNGGLVLEPSANVTAVTRANPATVTASSLAFSNGNLANGDWVYFANVGGMTQLNGKTFIAQGVNLGAKTFTLTDLDGNAIDSTAYSAFTSGGTVARIFTLVTPYAAADLALLKYTQSADVMTLTHSKYTTRQLTRTQDYAWTITAPVFAPANDPPTNVAAFQSAAGTTVYNYVVTSVDISGRESLASAAGSCTGATLSTTANSHNTVSWNPVSGVSSFNIYRQAEVPGSQPAPGSQYGFIGTVINGGTSFVDNNINPDFSVTPPQPLDPFVSKSIASVTVTAGGTGYDSSTTLVVTDSTGSGAELTPVITAGAITGVTVDAAGGGYTAPTIIALDGSGGVGASAVVSGYTQTAGNWFVTAVSVISGGTGYSAATVALLPGARGTPQAFSVTISAGAITAITPTGTPEPYPSNPLGRPVTIIDNGTGGHGATFSAVLADTPINPSCSAYYQDRQVFAGTDAEPDGVLFSRTADYLNFSYCSPARDDDSISATLVSRQVNAIKHLVPMTSLLALTSSGAWKIDGGTQNDAITPSRLVALPQAYHGCFDVTPLVIGYDVLYVQNKGSAVRDLAYNFALNFYTGTDISVLAAHLTRNHQIIDWAYCEDPHRVIWAVRDDGVFLSLTYLKEQEVQAWCRHDTQGRVKSVCAVSEGNENALYLIVERRLHGRTLQFIERMASRDLGGDPTIGITADLDRAWFVDCGLRYPLSYPSADLTPTALDASAKVASITIAAGGSGYVSPTATVVDDTGSGAVLSVVVSGGVITAINVVSGGSGYGEGVNPTTVRITDAAGTGAAASAVLQRPVTMNASSSIFVSGDVGKIVRVNGGRGRVVSQAGSSIVVDIAKPLTSLWPALSGDWSMTAETTTVTGLDHLEGQTVAILADGSVRTSQVVTNGAVTLAQAASSIVVGLPFTSQLQTLPLATGSEPTDQGKRKKVTAVTMRCVDTVGIKAGPSFDRLNEVKQRDFQPMGDPIEPATGDLRVLLEPDWNVPGQVCAQQDYPLPCSISALIPEVAIGDTP